MAQRDGWKGKGAQSVPRALATTVFDLFQSKNTMEIQKPVTETQRRVLLMGVERVQSLSNKKLLAQVQSALEVDLILDLVARCSSRALAAAPLNVRALNSLPAARL